MTASYDYDASSGYGASPVQNLRGARTLSGETATAVVVGVSLVLLIAIRRGFRGVNVGGVGVNIR